MGIAFWSDGRTAVLEMHCACLGMMGKSCSPSPSFQIYRRKKSCQLRTHAVYMLPGLAWAVPNGKTNGAEMCNADKATTQCHMVHGAVCVQLSFFKQQTNPSYKISTHTLPLAWSSQRSAYSNLYSL